jgi:heme/copper-type cytochrome/quinol oxidase subunit 1
LPLDHGNISSMKYPPLTWDNLMLSAILFMVWPLVVAEFIYVALRRNASCSRFANGERYGQEA